VNQLIGEANWPERLLFWLFLATVPMGVLTAIVTRGFLVQPAANLWLPVDFSEIFAHNFMLNLFGLVTGGASDLIANFTAYWVLTVSLLMRPSITHADFGIWILTVVATAILEVSGSACFTCAGFAILERTASYVEKRPAQTQLKIGNLFAIGTILLFIAAQVEAVAILSL
jgi:hypothetical protein